MTEEQRNSFYIKEIDDTLFSNIYGITYKNNCTVPREDLRYLHVMHVGFDGLPHAGEIIVHKAIAETVLQIFQELFEAGYEIEKVVLMDAYNADDELAMADNNSMGFNFRFISHSTVVSKHGLGMAVDINTLYNPYIKEVDGKTVVAPENAGPHVDRSADFPHKIDEEDLAYRLFIQNGFEWGGAWDYAKDYQHFEVPTKEILKLYPDYLGNN